MDRAMALKSVAVLFLIGALVTAGFGFSDAIGDWWWLACGLGVVLAAQAWFAGARERRRESHERELLDRR